MAGLDGEEVKRGLVAFAESFALFLVFVERGAGFGVRPHDPCDDAGNDARCQCGALVTDSNLNECDAPTSEYRQQFSDHAQERYRVHATPLPNTNARRGAAVCILAGAALVEVTPRDR
jgi:hypothetical protein